ncbi:MAG: DUF1521 domain-containing protein [Acidobacteria bacterium]|nr:DUF1521 domain-containing protein [Acidobacteriota bacterium]
MQVNQFNVQNYTFNVFNTVDQGMQAAGPGQVNQLQSLFSQALGVMDKMVDSLQALLGQSMSQMPPSGFVPNPGPEMQFPSNPIPGPDAQPGDGKTGLIQSGKEPPKFVTPGGYTVEAEKGSNAWKITTPEGQTSRIWGDPHVNESDGGKWDFKKGMSFVLPDGTKITAKTTPPGKNGYTVTQSIDIMNGNERATISGIDKNQPQSEGVKADRWAVDARVPDGDYAVMGGNGDDWFLHGRGEIVGSSKQGEVLHTKQGPGEGITDKAKAAMQEAPTFGSPQFMQQIMQQLLQRMMSPIPFGQFGGNSPFNPGGMTQPTGPQPGMGGWGMPPGLGTGQPNPGVGDMMGKFMETITNMFGMMKNLTGMMGELMQNIQRGGPGGGISPTVPDTQRPTLQGMANDKFNEIMDTFKTDQGGKPRLFDILKGKDFDKADNMIRDLTRDPALLGAMSPDQRGQLLEVLLRETGGPGRGENLANERSALDILRSAKDPMEFRQMADGAGGFSKLDGLFHGPNQGSFDFLMEKNGMRPAPGPFFLAGGFMHALGR